MPIHIVTVGCLSAIRSISGVRLFAEAIFVRVARLSVIAPFRGAWYPTCLTPVGRVSSETASWDTEDWPKQQENSMTNARQVPDVQVLKGITTAQSNEHQRNRSGRAEEYAMKKGNCDPNSIYSTSDNFNLRHSLKDYQKRHYIHPRCDFIHL